MNAEGEIVAKRCGLTRGDMIDQIRQWEERVENAAGFASAKEAATQLKLYVAEARNRGINVLLKYPIHR